MPVEIRVPQMGESVTEATILRWLKKEGDSVVQGEALAELETDKVNVEIPADVAGVLQKIAHAEGDTVAVGDVIAVMGDAASEAAAPAPQAAAPAAPPASEGSNGASPAPAASPLAQALASDNKVDLALVRGTGPAGRITKEDVTGYLGQSAPPAPPPCCPLLRLCLLRLPLRRRAPQVRAAPKSAPA